MKLAIKLNRALTAGILAALLAACPPTPALGAEEGTPAPPTPEGTEENSDHVEGAAVVVSQEPTNNLVAEPVILPTEPGSVDSGAEHDTAFETQNTNSPPAQGSTGAPPAAAATQPQRNRYQPSGERRPRPTSRPAKPLPDGQTNAAPSGPAPLDFSAFKIISERNIFDPNRSPRRSAQVAAPPKERRVDSLKLVGIMSYQKGKFAFFDGTSQDYRKALKVSDEIAGFRVADIERNSVKLAGTDNQLELKVGSQLRREESGQWELSNSAIEIPETRAVASTSAPAPTGATQADDEVLKRMMQRREKE